MIASSQKLRNPFDFAHVREVGRFVEYGCFRLTVVVYRTRCLSRTGRFGLIASKKNLGNAVRRNRAKRVFRALWQAHKDTLPVLCDASVLIRRTYAKVDHAALSSEFRAACERLAAYFAAHPQAFLEETLPEALATPPDQRPP